MPGLRAAAWSVAGAAVRWTAAIASRAAAVGPNHRPARNFGGFGDGSILGWPTGPVFGEQWIWIGSDTLIAPHVTLSAGMANWEDTRIEPVVRIGTVVSSNGVRRSSGTWPSTSAMTCTPE